MLVKSLASKEIWRRNFIQLEVWSRTKRSRRKTSRREEQEDQEHKTGNQSRKSGRTPVHGQCALQALVSRQTSECNPDWEHGGYCDAWNRTWEKITATLQRCVPLRLCWWLVAIWWSSPTPSYSTLTVVHITDEDYKHGLEVWESFNCWTLGGNTMTFTSEQIIFSLQMCLRFSGVYCVK